MLKAATSSVSYKRQPGGLHMDMMCSFRKSLLRRKSDDPVVDMSSAKPLDYAADLQEFAVSEAEYLGQHAEYHVLVTGAAVFNKEGKLLLVQRAADETAFPNYWVSCSVLFAGGLSDVKCPRAGWGIDTAQEIPGGKVDDTDESILHAAARELKEETGLEARRVVRKVDSFTFVVERAGRPATKFLKMIFEIEVDRAEGSAVVLDAIEHQQFVFASEDEVAGERVGDVQLEYISARNKAVKLEAFRLRGARGEASIAI